MNNTTDQATPNSIEEAIGNAHADINEKVHLIDDDVHGAYDGPVIRKHIKDFLAQKFGLLTPETEKLWLSIFPEDKKG